MTEPMREFVVSFGFNVDSTSMARAEAGTKAAEDRITQNNAAALAKRIAEQNRANAERIAADLAAGRQISEQDKSFIEAQEKRRRAAADEAQKREAEGFKKSNLLRDEQFKQASQHFLRLEGVAQAFSSGLSGALGALPFGGMVLGVQRTAASLSDLAVQAQRVGASANHIQKFVYGMRFAGLSEGQANSALEGFAAKVKSNEPGFRNALEGLNVKTTDENGKPLDIEQLAEGFGNKLGTMDYTQARKLAESWGMADPDALNAFRNGQFRAGAGDYDDRSKAFGIDADKMSKDARDVSQAWLAVSTDLELINTKLQASFFVPLANAFDGLAKKMEQNPEATEAVGKGLEVVAALAAARALPSFVRMAMGALGLGNPVTATATAVAAGGAAAGAEKAPMVDEYGRVVGNWGGDPDHPFHQGEEGGPSEGDTSRPTTNFSTIWSWLKGKIGLGDDDKVKRDIATTAEGVTKLVEGAIGVGTGISAGGGGDGGAIGAARRTLGWAGRALGGGQEGRGGGPTALRTDQQKANAAAIADELKKAGAPNEGVAAVLGSMQTESSFSPRAHNDVTGGHTGLWQWDARRWPKVRAWIESQGGDPWDARWQTRAYIAEGRAKPGDAIYDNGETSAGFRDVMDSRGDLGKAVHGVQRSERFGVGEEGGRAAHALKWIGHLPENPAALASSAPASAPTMTDAEVAKAEAWIKSLGIDHPLTQAEHDRLGPLQKQIDAYYASRSAKTMDHQGKWAKPTYADGRPVGTGKEIERGKARAKDDDEFPTAVAPDKPVKVEVTDASAAKVGKGFASSFPAGQTPRSANPLADLKKDMFDEFIRRHAAEAKRFGLSPANRSSMNSTSIRHGDYNSAGDTFHIHAKDAKSGLDAAEKLSAHRQYAERIRYGQRSQA